jgi:hypothetical protein
VDSREGAIMAWEDGLAATECALGRARAECDAECDRAKAARQDYWATIRTFTAGCKHSFIFDRILQEHRILLSLQEMDLERLEEEQAQGLYSLDGRDLPAELEELHASQACGWG